MLEDQFIEQTVLSIQYIDTMCINMYICLGKWITPSWLDNMRESNKLTGMSVSWFLDLSRKARIHVENIKFRQNRLCLYKRRRRCWTVE